MTKALFHDALRDIITAKSFRRGAFTLASGTSSSYFFDLKPTMLDPDGANLIGDMMSVWLQTHLVDAIGGMAIGAVPIIAVTVAKSSLIRPIPGFYIRKEAKDHGIVTLIQGLDVAGKTVALVEDVTTTGGSLILAAKTIRDNGGTVAHAITVIDRLEGGEKHLRSEGIALHAILTINDFVLNT